MKITPQTVDELARLARLSIPEEERPVLTGQLEEILACMEALDGLDTEGDGIGGALPSPAWAGPREDSPQPSDDRDALLANAPAAADGAFLVPRTVE